MPDLQGQIDRLRYLTGATDSRPLLDGNTDTEQEQETILAGGLCGKHLGLTVRSLTFSDMNKTTRAPAVSAPYRIDTIHHLKNGAILINGSWPYLRSNTVLTVVDEGNRMSESKQEHRDRLRRQQDSQRERYRLEKKA